MISYSFVDFILSSLAPRYKDNDRRNGSKVSSLQRYTRFHVEINDLHTGAAMKSVSYTNIFHAFPYYNALKKKKINFTIIWEHTFFLLSIIFSSNHVYSWNRAVLYNYLMWLVCQWLNIEVLGDALPKDCINSYANNI